MAVQRLISAVLHQSAPMAQDFLSFWLPAEKLCGVISNLAIEFRNRIKFGTRQKAGQPMILCLIIWFITWTISNRAILFDFELIWDIRNGQRQSQGAEPWDFPSLDSQRSNWNLLTTRAATFGVLKAKGRAKWRIFYFEHNKPCDKVIAGNLLVE
jgi:hypothetical protein